MGAKSGRINPDNYPSSVCKITQIFSLWATTEPKDVYGNGFADTVSKDVDSARSGLGPNVGFG